ncbi:DUF1376 domain-containing protein [Mesorhizobium sp. ESP7-2]|uniref:DUF1376 domain-containing protein n=1 Tax=Mesorhizobium sp. ESP7-2 TaxID=2876622 RepID=UPI001CCA49CD|nr:DUF1376 domain-containing protein [Mesorhizobium sp. ESP7-2]MBZ9710546.1 DUF1376 domain-containing protein [Mesorhizobium sp. ESP7-2]
MTHLPFIQQSCGDVLAETAHLSTEEFGAYQLLVFAFWQHGALPEDDTRLARIVRATPERWAVMRDTLSELFGVDWMPERLAERRDEVEATHLKNKANGRKGAQARWNRNGEANGGANGEAISRANGEANGEANGNHNHNYNSPGHEGKALPYTHARAREDVVAKMAPPTTYPRRAAAGDPGDKVDQRFDTREAAGKWLADAGAFPGDTAFAQCVDKLMQGNATWGDVEAAA